MKKPIDKKATIKYNLNMGKAIRETHCIRMHDSIRNFKILLGSGVCIS